MCGTCGCGSDSNGPVISKPRENEHVHLHSHDEHHHNHHSRSHHEHHHDGHSHAHPEHTHTHNSHSHDHKHKVLEIEQDILQNNQILAARNRGYFEAKNIFALNLVSSPGSGKTSLLERTLADLKDEIPFYVIEGDQQTLNDANRIDALKIPVVQINTGKGCHLESDMVYDAVKELEMKDNSILMIENVGNLVCPSMFDLGESKRVVIISTTEGEDKPIKYPDMFHTSDICIINKIDLLPYVNIDVQKLKDYALQVNPKLKFFEVSATNGDGMDAWYKWLKSIK
ncbi:hydrogenase nickel incorporation protein HypB [Lutibacter oceani]|uniref:Hydrogenase nickel incorporation protein HypB n=1 Tax=Lutibacter oceani TaxID=1853311 RepID=A0A3D9RW04_9FLAO|nr:hydrogenase nickel incorporation protein HypB [Lutibacter oceani]REE80822.1 hydrogenase nickel incorporation protein HypB [Lutibacter oceani]